MLQEWVLRMQAIAPWPADDVDMLLSTRYIDREATEAADEGKKDRCLSKFATQYPAAAVELIRATEATRITEHGQFYREARSAAG